MRVIQTWVTVFIGIVLLMVADSSRASKLSALAANMQAGEWREVLHSQHLDSGFLEIVNAHGVRQNLLQYSDAMKWDSQQQQLYFIGGGHATPAYFIRYELTTDNWSKQQLLQLDPGHWSERFSHGYDHTAIDQLHGRLFHKQYYEVAGQGDRLNIYDIKHQRWSLSAVIPSDRLQCCGALDYFPALDAVVFVDGDWGVFLYFPDTDTWQRFSKPLAMGGFHNFAEYNPRHELLLFGGGDFYPKGYSRRLYQLNKQGVISEQAEAPLDLGILHSLITVDPVSGDYLVMSNDGSVWMYQPIQDTWRQLKDKAAFYAQGEYPGVAGAVAAAINELGVIAVLKYGPDHDTHFYLFKPPLAAH